MGNLGIIDHANLDGVNLDAYGAPMGLRLKELREQAGLSQAILAARADVSVRTIQRLELGRTQNPSARILKAICQELGVDAHALLDWQPPEVGSRAVTGYATRPSTEAVGDPVPPAEPTRPPAPRGAWPGGEVPLHYR